VLWVARVATLALPRTRLFCHLKINYIELKKFENHDYIIITKREVELILKTLKMYIDVKKALRGDLPVCDIICSVIDDLEAIKEKSSL
jgi:hypothetical protein